MMTFAQRIKELRRGKGWSVYDLANRLGVQSPGYISKIEARGEIPSPDMVIKLAEVLGTDPEELIELAKQEKARELTENVQKKYDNAFALHRKAKNR
jgi:transcriptional regulator with XRE-family HTH domain